MKATRATEIYDNAILSRVRQIDNLDYLQMAHLDYLRIDHLDHLDLRLTITKAVQDLYSPDPTRETCPAPCRLYGSRAAT